jgi:hypothetical protein
MGHERYAKASTCLLLFRLRINIRWISIGLQFLLKKLMTFLVYLYDGIIAAICDSSAMAK